MLIGDGFLDEMVTAEQAEILNGRGWISSACVGHVGEIMHEKTPVSSLVKCVGERISTKNHRCHL